MKKEDDMKTKKVRELEDQRKRVSKRGMGGEEGRGGWTESCDRAARVGGSVNSLSSSLPPSFHSDTRGALSQSGCRIYASLSLPLDAPPPPPTLYPPLQDSQWVT